MNRPLTQDQQKKIFLTVFLAFPTILLLAFIVYPGVKLVFTSFTNWDGISLDYKLVGFDNFRRVFNNPVIWNNLRNNSLYFFAHLILIPIELYIAFILDRFIRKNGWYKSIFFLPVMINVVAVSYMFSFLYSSQGGVLNEILAFFNMAPVAWLSDKNVVNWSLVAVSLWMHNGMTIMLFLAGLQSIPYDMIEAATLDGAGPFAQFYHIIIPNIKTVITLVMFLNARGALMVFEIPFVMTSGGPNGISSTYAVGIINSAFDFSNFGLASAMAIILICIILIIVAIQNRIFKLQEGNKNET